MSDSGEDCYYISSEFDEEEEDSSEERGSGDKEDGSPLKY